MTEVLAASSATGRRTLAPRVLWTIAWASSARPFETSQRGDSGMSHRPTRMRTQGIAEEASM